MCAPSSKVLKFCFIAILFLSRHLPQVCRAYLFNSVFVQVYIAFTGTSHFHLVNLVNSSHSQCQPLSQFPLRPPSDANTDHCHAVFTYKVFTTTNHALKLFHLPFLRVTTNLNTSYSVRLKIIPIAFMYRDDSINTFGRPRPSLPHKTCAAHSPLGSLTRL